MPAIRRLLPQTFKAYYEPFLGGGALFFATAPSLAYLSDQNSALIEMYCTVRDHPARVINALESLPISSDDYYRIRADKPSGKIARAARFIYLVSLSFNGLYRENQNGDFNTPYSSRKSLSMETASIHEVSRVLASAKIAHMDFADAMSTASAGDLIYLDPPYTVAHGKNGFVQYNSRLFSWKDQERLAECARGASARGCYVIVSNADHESITRLYQDFKRLTVERASTIAAATAHRKPVSECIFHNLPEVEHDFESRINH